MIRVLQGHGRYDDPWHPFEESSNAVATILADLGDVEVLGVAPDALADLDGVDLLVVNTGCGDPDNPPQPDPTWAAAFGSLHEWVQAGGPTLALHTAAASFTDSAYWADDLGGRWVRGVSMHPPRDEVGFAVLGDHPIVAGLGNHLEVREERYSFMEQAPQVTALLSHQFEGAEQVMAWVHETGGVRAVYNGMGHDASSYAQQAEADFVLSAARWLLR